MAPNTNKTMHDIVLQTCATWSTSVSPEAKPPSREG